MTDHVKPSAIIFDFDDTLIDSMPTIKKALDSTFAEFGISKEIITTNKIDINRSLRDYFEQVFAEKLPEARAAYYKHYKQYAQNLTAFENAENVLKFLQQKAVYTVVVSNKNGPGLRAEINDLFAWQDYFKAIVGAGDAQEDKPSALPALLALEKSGLTDYSNVWFIGDTIVDLETARNLGCKAILYGSNSNIEIKAPVYLKVKDHNNLLQIFKEIYV